MLRRMFSGYGISVNGVNFAMALRDGLIFRVNDETVARYEAEGSAPFQYQSKNKTVVVKSYWHVPERLYDDPDELAAWARAALTAAQRASAKKPAKRKKAAGSAKTETSKILKPKTGAKKPDGTIAARVKQPKLRRARQAT